ncbi:uncharacterized protein AC631_00303 [Debaryomyces fabryi]|uniref:RNA helicase n=1 Tax=Debaryomyces fabryi TaxID=58627 RepID=A0A0V1Q5T0_9ASCO|nr:uncharacterized protein AC631_00303 [Debaryomyces fabryi]KSA03848.1 hypothetical protein AC631_00303 [Debaryomyces fabryi]CUM48653.1 unnamed protein product [Debaryomyces fabryi]
MSDKIKEGKGKRRKRTDEDQWLSESDNEQEDDKSNLKVGPGAGDDVAMPSPGILQALAAKEQKENYDDLRDLSRQNYLKKRQTTKLNDLSLDIEKYKSVIKERALTKQEQEDFQYKQKIFKIITETDESLQSIGRNDEYQLPDDYFNTEGKLDKKRKLNALNAKNNYDKTEKGETTKRNRYENQWELDQLNKAQISNVVATDEINLPNQDDYEFVFDESQFVSFDQDQPLEGDKPDENTQTSKQKASMDEVRKSLPVYKYREQFLDAISKYQVLIVVGETGSGKTTQLPQYLHEAGYSKGNDGKILKIGCTQPRRVAATSVANRIADEMGVSIGEEVGYSIRFEDKSSDKTLIKYLTDGMLLREFLTDPELSSYGALMIDEAHERTVSTEIILSLLKDIIQIRKDLKLIIASATMNAEKFSNYFDGAPIFNIPGRRFPVDIHYTKNPEANYIQAALTTIFQIHTTQELPGDILVFLTGQDEIETMQESLEEACHKLGSLIKPLIICPVYASLPTDLQKNIFEPTPPNSRKIVLATNIAETSITIEGISYVIDPGYVKENVFNPVTGMESLVVVPCSRASANQRAGRAGRVGPGKCFRLYTKWSFYNEIQANPTPEILRVNLVHIILLLLSLGITDLINFEFIDPPSSDTLIKSLELLYALGALNSKGELTKTGRKMAEFPIDPMFAKCLISSSNYGVTNEILTIISMLSESSSLFYRPKDKREQADKKKESFQVDEGDHLTLLNLWDQWQDTGYSNQWCQDNFIQYKTLKRSKEVRQQLERLCKKTGIPVVENDNVNKKLMIQKSITAGFFPNIARLSKMGDSYRSLKKNQAVFIHPSSVLYPIKPPPKLILYHELVLTSKEFMRNCMLIDENWLNELAPHYYSKKDLDILSTKKRPNKFK